MILSKLNIKEIKKDILQNGHSKVFKLFDEKYLKNISPIVSQYQKKIEGSHDNKIHREVEIFFSEKKLKKYWK